MVLRVRLLQLGSRQQSLYPGGQHTHAFYIKCVPPVGQLVAVAVSTASAAITKVNDSKRVAVTA